ncbi:ABC-2 transporter permease [Paenibacillus anaericanus]|uniref:ABC-2 transporter permease n=1 Tax=Paenibacillus anaericanus TaxID=170367 RepID=A0A433Y6M0_9BACL|nr:ABC-2 transporter permease [Paenibacillus anaericanus]RUT44629.1 ABC-2 transporter permease [Paenibacillus anaericanus]
MHSMATLLRKDFQLIQRYLWLILIYAVVFSSLFHKDSQMLFGLLPGMIFILLNSLDMRISNQQFLVSLPVNRRFLVISKYTNSLIFIVLGFVLCMFINGMSDLYNNGQIGWNLQFVTGMLFSMILVVLIYLPLYYWLAHRGAQILNVAMMAVVMGGSTAIAGIINDSDSVELMNWMVSHQAAVWWFGLCSVLLCLFISYRISLQIFMKRDL